jgi:hypothetical protein
VLLAIRYGFGRYETSIWISRPRLPQRAGGFSLREIIASLRTVHRGALYWYHAGLVTCPFP